MMSQSLHGPHQHTSQKSHILEGRVNRHVIRRHVCNRPHVAPTTHGIRRKIYSGTFSQIIIQSKGALWELY